MKSNDDLSPEDPIVQAQLERTLTPYRELLTPELLLVFREEILRALTTDPVAKDLIRRLKPPPVAQESGERAIAAERKLITKAKKASRGSR